MWYDVSIVDNDRIAEDLGGDAATQQADSEEELE